MPHGFSKENQSTADAAYRFGEFELHPTNRRLLKAGAPILLAPKTFDALLYLVRRAEHLVSKQELIGVLWPDVHVSGANLTNTIVTLRKIVGRDAIHTVSKHGYRFAIPVTGEPGVSRATFERFVRAKELTRQRSLGSMRLAQNLLWTCLAENPGFAPAWAWLGRCSWFLEKFSLKPLANREQSQAALHRAFALDPDLACAHRFYTLVQVDSGSAREAMCRLLERLKHHPCDPESYEGLVQALRFCGLLELSIESHRRAIALDPAIVTSVAHTLFLTGDYAAAIEAYSGRAAYYLDAAAWAALGNHNRAMTLLRDRLSTMSLSRLMTALMSSLLALLEGRTEETIRLLHEADTTRDPEILVYFARHYSQMGQGELALNALKRAAKSGFICPPSALKSDSWLRALREHPEFQLLLGDAESLVEEGRLGFKACTEQSDGWPL